MKDFLKKNRNKLITTFLIVQPIIDVITSIFLNVFHLEITFGIIIRMLFLGLIIFYNLFVEKEKVSTKYTILIGIYTLLFMGNVYFGKGMDACFYELKNLMRYLYFPLLLINMYGLIKNEKLEIKQNTIQKIYWIYLLLILIPMLTNTSFTGYFEGKVGTIGWFNATNEIGAILSGLLPLIFIKGQSIWKIILLFLAIVIVFFSLGSKVTIFALLLTVLYFGIKIFKKSSNKKKIITITAPVFITGIITAIILIPKTNFYKNIEIHLDFLKVDSIVDIFKDEHLIDHFIFSSRLTFLENTRTSYLESPITSKVLGVGFIENYGTDQVNLKTIEMDIFDIFYRLGILGFILYLIPLYIVISNKKNKSNSEEKLSLALFIFISSLAGHVLTSPAVSIYLILILLNLIKEEVPCKQEL